MYCESIYEAHQGRMFANMALVVARLRRSLRARLQQSIVKSASISCARLRSNPKPFNLCTTYEKHNWYIETQLHGSRDGETPSTEDTRFARFDYI